MNITTTYKTNSTGAGVIEARCGDRRKTSKYDHSKSVNENHGTAAGALINEKFAEFKRNVVSVIDHGNAKHYQVADGKQRFEV